MPWAVSDVGGGSDGYYPTQAGADRSGGARNFGGYSSSEADRLIAASRSSPTSAAVRAQLAYLARSLPALYLPDAAPAYAVSGAVGGSAKAFLLLAEGDYRANLFYLRR